MKGVRSMKKGIPKQGSVLGTCAGVFFLCASALAEPLDIAAILAKVDRQNPQIEGIRGAIEVADSEIDQARLLPNPEFEIGTENFGNRETEAMLSLPLEPGGKRKCRVAAAKVQQEEVAMQLEALRLRLHAEALRRAYTLMAVNSRIAVADTMLSLALSDKKGIDRRIEAGAAMELDGIRSQIGIEEMRMQREALLEQKRSAANYLAALWGDSAMTTELNNTLQEELPRISADAALQKLSQHPQMQLAAINVRLNEARLSQEKAEAFPETALQGGYLRNNEQGENSVLLGFSMRLPLFNRNQGAISAQRKRVSVAQEERNALLVTMQADVRSLVSELTSLRKKIVTLEHQIIPQQVKVHTSLKNYYTRGLVSILEVLESRSALVEKQLEAVDLRGEWARKAADLVEISGFWQPFKTRK